MAVSIDTVYQKVLMLANKEQRGYITPQEFNLFADQAQKEIFEQYFYDLNQLSRISSNSKEYSDIVDNVNEKVAIFEKYQLGAVTLTPGANYKTGVITTAFPMYRLGSLIYNSISNGMIEIEEIQANEALYLQSPLVQPSILRPVYVRTSQNTINLYPNDPAFPSVSESIDCNYITVPVKPNWSYVVVNEKAMYNPQFAVNFELHQAEESELIYKILKFAGVSMRRNDISSAGQGLEAAQIQQEKQ